MNLIDKLDRSKYKNYRKFNNNLFLIQTENKYPDNTKIEIFLCHSNNEIFYLSDIGQTISWFLDTGIKLWNIKEYTEYIETIKIKYKNFKNSEGELIINLTNDTDINLEIENLSNICLNISEKFSSEESENLNHVTE
jgi:hypothetical protein